jgi:hypothetical protein
MLRRPIVLVLLLLAVVAVGVPESAVASPARSDGASPVSIAGLDARIEKAQARVNRWYARIERWYGRIDRAARRVERLEEVDPSTSTVSPVLRRTVPRRRAPASPLEHAQQELRRVLKDPWARHVQAELDTWSAFLAEMVHARERAVQPAPAEDRSRSDGGDERRGPRGLLPGQPVTYEGWAGAFLRRLEAPRCDSNLLIVVTWQTAESTSAAFNPLATTREMPGATDMNSVGVKDFVSLDQGLDASRDTLLLGAESYGYGAIVDSLRRCRSASSTARAINASAWCRGCVGGTYIVGLLPIVRGSYAEHAARLVSTSA